MRLFSGSLGTLLLSGLLASACGSQTNSHGSYAGKGSGAAGNGIVLNPGSDGGSMGLSTGGGGGGGAGGTGTTIQRDAACATGTAQASLAAVNMFVMFDRSSSMENEQVGQTGKNRWDVASAALRAFFQSPNAAGLALALRFFPHDLPATGCVQTACDVNACSRALVDLGTLNAKSAPMDAHEKALVDATLASSPTMGDDPARGGTPISAALAGALRWASGQHQKTPNESNVVVLVTDGQPNGCDQDVGHISQLAADALGADGTLTYAIGLTGSREADMDQIAAAGGTTKGIFVADGADTQQQLLDALRAIRGDILDCDFPVPTAKPGTKVNPAEVNVNWTPGSGVASTLGQVPSAAGCTGADGWYYDDPTNPSRIELCKATCDAVSADPQSKLEILLGCAAVVRPPR